MVDYDPANQNATSAPLSVLGGKPSIADLKDAILASDVAAKYPAATLHASTKNDLIYICRLEDIDVPGLPGVADYPVAAPTITTHPANISVADPAPAAFTVVAVGDGPLQYQWQKQDLGAGAWVNVGTDDDEFSTGATIPGDDTDKYRVVVTNSGGSTTSNEATLTVT